MAKHIIHISKAICDPLPAIDPRYGSATPSVGVPPGLFGCWSVDRMDPSPVEISGWFSRWWLKNTPLKNMSQLGWLATQYSWENKKWQPNHQPVMIWHDLVNDLLDVHRFSQYLLRRYAWLMRKVAGVVEALDWDSTSGYCPLGHLAIQLGDLADVQAGAACKWSDQYPKRSQINIRDDCL